MSSLVAEENEDLVLVQQCVAGRPEALAALQAKYQPVLVNVLVARGAAHADAEDVVSDIWLRCVPDTDKGQSLLEKFNGKCPLRSWLLTVAFRKLIDMLRRRKFELSTDDESDDRPPLVVADRVREERDEALIELLRESLQAAFDHCPAADLLMLRLVYLHGLSQREVCRMWGWHEAKVSRRLSQAMKNIEKHTLKGVQRRDPWLKLTWQDFVDMCQTHQIGFL